MAGNLQFSFPSGGTFALKYEQVAGYTGPYHTFKYSLDDSTWSNYTLGTAITVPSEGSLYFTKTSDGVLIQNYDYLHYYFEFTGEVSVTGSISAMGDMGPSAFRGLFKGCSTLTKAPDLSGYLTLAASCYESLFEGCTSLQEAPYLAAAEAPPPPPGFPSLSTGLGDYCYRAMFKGCTSLTSTPVLNTKLMQRYCYESMFEGCTSLTTIGAVQATTLATGCFFKMFKGCTSLGSAEVSDFMSSLYTRMSTAYKVLTEECFRGMFQGCTSITTPPSLPWTTLAYRCYASMFEGCTALAQAPSLGATVLKQQCYMGMFARCTSLTSAAAWSAVTLDKLCCESMYSGCSSLVQCPTLPSTIADGCYEHMFKDCTALVTGPSSLPGDNHTHCYYGMFEGCTSLKSAPTLSSTVLADACYAYMFEGCSSLVTAQSILPATTLARSCYYGMFKGCTKLVSSPSLPATSLEPGCYATMFHNCFSLTRIEVSFTHWGDYSCTYNWVCGITGSGTFDRPAELPPVFGVNAIPEGWDGLSGGFPRQSFEPSSIKIELEYDTSDSESVPIAEGPGLPALYYRFAPAGGDPSSSEEWSLYEYGTVLVLGEDRIEFRKDPDSSFTGYNVRFYMTGNIRAGGNLGRFIQDSGKKLFKDCVSLKFAEFSMPKYLKPSMLKGAFQNSGIYQTPVLPAPFLSEDCYKGMFYDCRDLTSGTMDFTDWGPDDSSDSEAYGTTDWLCGNTPATGHLYHKAPLIKDCHHDPWCTPHGNWEPSDPIPLIDILEDTSSSSGSSSNSDNSSSSSSSSDSGSQSISSSSTPPPVTYYAVCSAMYYTSCAGYTDLIGMYGYVISSESAVPSSGCVASKPDEGCTTIECAYIYVSGPYETSEQANDKLASCTMED